jgi:hypothetical protein
MFNVNLGGEMATAAINRPLFAVAGVLTTCALALGQRSASHLPRLEIFSAPQYDCGGPEKTATLAGKVDGEKPEQYVVILYSQGCNGTAYIQPTAASPKTRVSPTGDFRAEIHLGTTYYALLVKPDAKTEFKPQVTADRQQQRHADRQCRLRARRHGIGDGDSVRIRIESHGDVEYFRRPVERR